MKIIQISTTVQYGDGVGNDILALHNAIIKMGYKTAIYAENIDERINKHTKARKLISHISNMPKLNDNDIVLYHLSIGTRLNYEIKKMEGRKVIIYHNITPPDFFCNYSRKTYRACIDGMNGMRYLSDTAEYCLADSEFNKKELIAAGYKCKIDVLPILIPFNDYKRKPNQQIIDEYSNDDYTNLLFVGRIAPNKKQEDIIRAFYQYHNKYNSKSRLFLVGSYQHMQSYYQRLLDYVEELELSDVYFIGHVNFDEILAYYRIADLFLCMSEHEGFCIPLVEAMFFNIPILAYDSSAVGSTLGGSGFLTKTKNPLVNAALINRILIDEKLRIKLIENEKERLRNFDNAIIEKKFEECMKTFIGEKNEV